jgi:hypothetical protein
MRCGQELPEERLWPAPDYPGTPILLEHAGMTAPGWGHRRSPQSYILWRYDREKASWVELARAASIEDSWVHTLLPIARRAIEEQASALPALNCSQAANTLLQMLDEHLSVARGQEKQQLLSLLYNGVVHRLTESEDSAQASASYNERRGPEKERGSRKAGKPKEEAALA